MSTAVSGTFSVRILVASSPSIPGMRTSMITTSGLRRSVSATAVAPSEASPTTRMCGARESDRRRPSRTTSWSSTIKQVIAGGGVANAASGSVVGQSDRERKLLRRGFGPEADPASVADAEFPLQHGYALLHRPRLVRAEIRLSPIEALVLREQLGPVLGQ